MKKSFTLCVLGALVIAALIFDYMSRDKEYGHEVVKYSTELDFNSTAPKSPPDSNINDGSDYVDESDSDITTT